MVLINQVSYPAFSRLQADQEKFNKFYLDIIKVTATIVLPLFVGGFMVGGELITVLLGDKWVPIIFIFEWLCLSQIITAINGYNNFVHDARGKPKLALLYNFICASTMSVSFYFAVKSGFNSILIPWFTVYLFISVGWIVFTLSELNIGIVRYLKMLVTPFVATILMALVIKYADHLIHNYIPAGEMIVFVLLIKIIVGVLSFGIYIGIFDKKLINDLKTVRRVST